MKARTSTTCLTLGLLLLMALPVRADDAQDAAEAKSRGITVAQLQAEKALAAEKQKTADAEKTLAELNKKITDLEAARAAAAPPGVATDDGTAMYKDFVKRYMAGNWDKLATDIIAKKTEIAALPQQNQDDLAYIQQAVTDGRQAWWDTTKSGKTAQFKAAVWKDTVAVSYSNGPSRPVPAGGSPVALSWPAALMDSFDALSLTEVGLGLNGNFRKGDEVEQLLWGDLATADLYQSIGADKIRTLSAAEKTQLTPYSAFWSAVTAGYYGTPGARRLIMVQALASFEPINDDRPDWLGKRPIGSAILIEMKVHKDIHKTAQGVIVNVSAVKDPHQFEMFKSKLLVLSFSGSKLTFEEDKAFREVFKTLAEANTSWNVSKLSLQNDLSYDLNVQDDVPLAEERKKFLGN